VFKYSITSKAWSLLHIASTSIKQTATTSFSRIGNGLAYDPASDSLFLFYRPQSTSAVTNCDIIKGTDGAEVQIGIQVSDVGNTSYMTPIFCSFDNNLAKFVWQAGKPDTASADTTGWLYGVSVNSMGTVVWSGKAAHPTADYAQVYTSSMTQIAQNAKYRYKKGAIVGTFQTGSAVNTSNAVMIAISSQNDRISSNYLTFDIGTNQSGLAAPTSLTITGDGLAVINWDSLKSYPALAVIKMDDFTMLSFTAQSTTANKYTLYNFPALNKSAAKISNNPAQVFSLSSDGLLEREFEILPSIFTTDLPPARECIRYKILASSSTSWLFYDYLETLPTPAVSNESATDNGCDKAETTE
jgi:hypothetical protein